MAELDDVATAAARIAADVATTAYGERVRQVITILTITADADDIDDTSLATVAIPGAETPEAVLDTLLGHVQLAAKRLGGEVRIIGLGDIGRG